MLAAVRDATERIEAERRVRPAEARYRALVENTPAVHYERGQGAPWALTYVGPQVSGLLGYPPQHFVEDPGFWVSIVHPDDRERLVAGLTAAQKSGEWTGQEYRLLAADGRTVWVRDTAASPGDGEGEPTRWQGVLVDITERRVAAEASDRRGELLDAVVFAAERFLRASGWVDAIDGVLARFGRVTRVGSVSLFTNRDLPGGGRASSIRAQWSAEGVESQLENPMLQDIPHEGLMARWAEELQGGSPIMGPTTSFPESERALLQPQGIRSILVVPVIVGEEWWGTLSFADVSTERTWEGAEVDALLVSASALAASIVAERASTARRNG